MKTSDFEYELPEELIADRPPDERGQSRMMVVNRAEGTIEHKKFTDLQDYLQQGDLLVLNDTRVVPARYFSNDGKIELLRVAKLSMTKWQCMVKPGKRMKLGRTVEIGEATGTVESILENGDRVIQFDGEVDEEKFGHLALPHYMGRDDDEVDRERYQTVYNRHEGAIAAPTAGLHFTPEILAEFDHAFVTLHVGVGTFQPVRVDEVEDHVMHSEQFVLGEEVVDKIAGAQRVVSIGTTVSRVLEHCGQQGDLVAQQGATDIFIYPPYSFKVVDVMLTNFHLPGSTLLMMVSAFAGKDLVREAYEQAIENEYRFYSYGDCMLIL
ncbi:MAG: tRNA preQ1(34) S-adenosylmethionine ribosyltransferase-isomerase QueA [Verrucomicrobiales bacterium]|nr:tRNA preQ1(34) S-adenosylmethionine ribosyltransferase-isomerase QueA [Verrucomicrobiales bacterium]